jgi:hypothetical protein
MEPYMGRIAFNIAFLLVLLSSFSLPFLKPDSAEFVVDVLALAISLTFLLVVVWDVRRQSRKEITIGLKT